jgi:hypothetical protein
MILLVIGLLVCLFYFDGLHSELRYAIEYNFPYSQVNLAKKPHDCDWSAAPFGNKNCHYEVTVLETTRTSTNAEGKPIYSYDGGKTWFLIGAEYSVKPGLRLGWKKVED